LLGRWVEEAAAHAPPHPDMVKSASFPVRSGWVVCLVSRALWGSLFFTQTMW